MHTRARGAHFADAYRRAYATEVDDPAVGEAGLQLGAVLLEAEDGTAPLAARERGDVYDVRWPGIGVRPALIATRPTANPYLTNVTVGGSLGPPESRALDDALRMALALD